MLFHSKTHWLPLFPAVQRILEMYTGLKSYFLSMEKSPNVLKKFFEDDFYKI